MKQEKLKIILASGSKDRQNILRTAGIKFQVIVSGVEEKQIMDLNPRERVVELAYQKAARVAEKNQGLVIGGDTFVCLGNEILEKPKSLKEAHEMLTKLSGKMSYCFSGLCVINTQTKEVYKKLAVTKVWFRELTDLEIKDYIETEPVLNWSAAFTPLSSKAIKFIRKIKGSLSGFAHGLPMEDLVPILHIYQLIP